MRRERNSTCFDVYRGTGLSLRALALALVWSVSALCPLRAGVSPGLSAYSGNGQITFEYQLTPSPLVVRAVDSNGAPLAGVPVFWSIARGQGNLVAPVAKTDSNGFAM